MIEQNMKTIQDIEHKYYFSAIEEKLKKYIKDYGEIQTLNYLTNIMQDSKDSVEDIIRSRVKEKIIKDPDQARKTVAGNGFQSLIAYCLIKLQTKGVIPENIVITLKPKRHPLIEQYAAIKVGDEIQKPDIDLLLYSKDNKDDYPILIYSIKTSLRERAGQTYRWKLLMDIATSDNCYSIKKKYGIKSIKKTGVMVGMITANFYKEITNPQQKGMLKFFDFVYITKNGEFDKPILSLSYIVDDLNRRFK